MTDAGRIRGDLARDLFGRGRCGAEMRRRAVVRHGVGRRHGAWPRAEWLAGPAP